VLRTLLALLFFAIPLAANAAQPVVVPAYGGVPLGYQQIAMSGAAVALTAPSGTQYAVIIPSTAATWRDDGTNPTSTVGMPIQANAALVYYGNAGLTALRVFGATGTLNVAYYQ